MMLSRYTHENLISLVGFCDEAGEKILVYEHACHGSLDGHLSSPLLTWIQRIKICLEAAQGLSYLHYGHGTQQRVLHPDIKSSNILLDENWKAKGTYGYVDPLYMETGILSKESDVYSFGVVLFEVLCGKLCYEKFNGQWKNLVRSWKQSYKQNNLVDIIFEDLAQQIDPECLETFSEIAFQCLQTSRNKRPTMSNVVEKLESALDSQENAMKSGKEWLEYYEEITRTALPPLKYRSKRELSLLLSNGVLLNGGKTWFSFDNNGNHCEMISIEEGSLIKSRIAYEEVQNMYNNNSRRTHVIRAQFLSPLITYTVNLVFKADFITKDIQDVSSNLKYRLVGETEEYLIPHLAGRREDGRMMVGLYQFTSDNGRTVDLQIEFELRFPSSREMVLEGIEFRPLLEKVEQEALEHEKVDTQYISDLDTYWEQILPNDYQEIIEWLEKPIRWTTNKDLIVLLMNNGKEWFSLNKNGKKCHMVSANNAFAGNYRDFILYRKSRFGKAAGVTSSGFSIESEIRSEVLSPETTYGTYLVYQLPENQSRYEAPVSVNHLHTSDGLNVNCWYIYLVAPQIPVIRRKVDENTHNPLNSPKLFKCLPQQRSDGWMEVQVWEFQTGTTTKMVHIKLKVMPKMCASLVVLGIELRPI